ncbi:histidine phosphatase family protein [Paenarthrobacter nitroguajacolicus]|uniref:histidine phosphatase family protein n=1 Tax=Paenarthrobacter nitroguajacolicus TaxID=211146 RepID=UPI0015BDDA36|nr:histidine phosphatase family protein [Paenarthrobacter nitroguajacolicus]NWL10991.1 histidine phosphatase family protein [Paenarthrobacter nitroguajacolicus]NWL31883.1 histidine phosphatase family protein [Paenarthrobacter nitroguajacolicus]
MKLLLIRHGQTPGNVAGQLDTAFPGPGLTELGERQAAALPEALADEAIEALYTSTLLRTHRTVAPLAKATGLEPTILDGVHEIEAGALEKKTDHESHLRYMSTVFAWTDGDLDVRMPGAFSGHDFFARFDASVRKVAQAGHSTAAIVSHGAAIRCWAGRRATDIDTVFAETHQLPNTGIVALEGDPEGGWRVLHWDQIPVGGMALADQTAEDPTGEALQP